MKYEFVLFDLDGTLSESSLGITKCVQFALRSIGIDEPDLKKLEHFVGPPLHTEFMKSYGVDEQTAIQLVDTYRERYQVKGIYESHMYKGIDHMLAHCYEMGMKLALASSKPEVFVRQIIQEAGFDSYFSVVVGSRWEDEQTISVKDQKPVIIKRALRALAPPKRERVVMVGDRIFDVQGAQANQIQSIGLTYGYGSWDELRDADVIVGSVYELEKELVG